MLVVSQLFGTFHDMLTLVAILSQSKNAIRRGTVDRNYRNYYETIKTDDNCDFLGLIALYENSQRRERDVRLEVYDEVRVLKEDILRRFRNKQHLLPAHKDQRMRKWRLKERQKGDREQEEYLLMFKLTLVCGFIEHTLKVRPPSLDDKQEKRLKLMKRQGIQNSSTICLLNSNYLKKPETL